MTRTGRHAIAAVALVSAVAASPALAQGKGKAKNPSPGASPLPSSGVIAPASRSAPFAWIDDASLLEPGAMVVAMSIMRWNGAGVAETQAPIVDMTVGLTSRVQLGLSMPHIVDGTDAGGSSGGLGTTYASGKVAVVDRPKQRLRVAVLPTLEILGANVVQRGDVNQSRVRWGVPVSLEITRESARFYGGSGYFSPGVWFAGAGVGVQPATRVAASASISRAWAAGADTAAPASIRNDVSGGLSYTLTQAISVFGSLGHTVATTADNGAGATLSAGICLVLPTSR